MSNNTNKYNYLTQRDYDAVAGPDWPSFVDFQQHISVPDFVYDEIDQMVVKPVPFDHPSFCVMPFYGWEHPLDTACCLLPKKYDLEKIQTDMLAGIRPKDCAKCWNLEDAGYKSDRMIKNETLDWYSNQDIFAMYEQCQRGANKIIHYKIETSNTCNSACITCGSLNSSLWGQYEQRNGVAPAKNWHLRLDQVAKQIDFANAKSIGFRGGEPLLSATNFEILEQLAQAGNTDCFINFTTNGSVPLSQAQKNILSKFSNINMCFSIDGVGPVFEYLRYPLKWPQLLKNIDYCRQRNITVSASYTVSNLNIMYHDQTCAWFRDNQIRFLVNPVYTPNHFRPGALPQSVKEKLLSRHNNKELQSFLNQHSATDDLDYAVFRQQIAQQDQWKSITMSKYLPELAELLG
jgi:pyruvate-formate lyase-activating enzyme